jgi:hypothetical protein
MNAENFVSGLAPSAETTRADQVRRPFDDALARYTTRLAAVSAMLAQRQQRAVGTYFETATQRLQQQSESNTREYQDLISAVENASTDKIATAQAAYLESVNALQNAALEVSGAALVEYLAEMQTAWQEGQVESQAAYEAYVGDVVAAFARVTADAVDPSTLSFIGQALASGAAWASMSMQYVAASIADVQKHFGFR